MNIKCPSCDKMLPNKDAIVFMWNGCPYSEQAYLALVKKYGKENVKKVIVDDPVETRNKLSTFFPEAPGTTVPFMILHNKEFVGSNQELQERLK